MSAPRTMREAIAQRDKADRAEFGAMVRGPTDAEFRRITVAHLRQAQRRALAHYQAIEDAIKLIKMGDDVEEALAMIREAIEFLIPVPPAPILEDVNDVTEEIPESDKVAAS